MTGGSHHAGGKGTYKYSINHQYLTSSLSFISIEPEVWKRLTAGAIAGLADVWTCHGLDR
jgi:hypothetical protein